MFFCGRVRIQWVRVRVVCAWFECRCPRSSGTMLRDEPGAAGQEKGSALCVSEEKGLRNLKALGCCMHEGAVGAALLADAAGFR